MYRHLAACLLVLMPGAAAAEGIASADEVGACVTAQIAANRAVADCVNQAQVACLGLAEGAPVAGLACYLEAEAAWRGYATLRLREIAEAAPEEIASIAAIELRYDVLQNLLQCDKMLELMHLREEPSAATRLQKARCDATALGLAYVKLRLQSRDIE